MSMQDPVADLLTRSRNAQAADFESVSMPSSKLKIAICQVLRGEGYSGEISVTDETKPQMTVQLKYYDGAPVIAELKRVSRPGLRIYKKSDAIPLVRSGLGVAIVSTDKGLLTDRVARKSRVGGEVLCTVF